MISSSRLATDRALDAVIIVYSLLDDHPASLPCKHYIRDRAGWCTSVLVLLEVQAILTRVYALEPALTAAKVKDFAAGPVLVLPFDVSSASAAIELSARLRIDLTDAALLDLAQTHQISTLVTEDRRLTSACADLGITAETPLDAGSRAAIAEWESANLSPKGLPRMLSQVHQWLQGRNAELADEFWRSSGGGIHLP
jgi:predicted nucleic acid-binding protein